MNGKTAVKFAAVITAAVLSVSSAYAMSVNWSASIDTGVVLADGVTAAPVGTTIELGYFSVSDAVVAGLTSAAQVTGDFVPWFTGAIGDGGVAAGEFAEAAGGPGAGFFSKQAYMIVITAGGSQYGAFKGTTALGTDGDAWMFPPSDTAAPPTFEVGDLRASNVLLGGYINNGSFNGADSLIVGGNAIELVPEPSSIALVVLGLLGGIGMIRRRR